MGLKICSNFLHLVSIDLVSKSNLVLRMFRYSAILHFIIVENRPVVLILIAAYSMIHNIIFKRAALSTTLEDYQRCGRNTTLAEVLDQIHTAQNMKMVTFQQDVTYQGSCFTLETNPNIAGYLFACCWLYILGVLILRFGRFLHNGHFDFREGGYIAFTYHVNHSRMSKAGCILAILLWAALYFIGIGIEIQEKGFIGARNYFFETGLPWLVLAFSLKQLFMPDDVPSHDALKSRVFYDHDVFFKRDFATAFYESNRAFCDR